MAFHISSTVAIHPAAQSWSERVVKNGGALPSGNTQRGLSNFYRGLDAAGLTSKMKGVNCFAPDNLIASITPLIVGTGIDPWTNNSFEAADLTIDGLQGNAAENRWLNTGVNPSSSFMSLNDGGLTLYNTTAHTAPSNEFAAWSGGYSQLLCNFDGGAYFDCYTNGGTGRISGTPLTNGLGFTSGNRTSATAEYLYKASSTVPFVQIGGPGGSPGASMPTVVYYLFAANNSGSPGFLSGKRFSFAAVHNGLTAGECQSFYNLVQTMRQQLGGGWV